MSMPLLIVETKGLPNPLQSNSPLWETMHIPPDAGAAMTGTRVYPSGELMSYGTTRRTYRDKMPGREAAPAAWRLDARLTPEAVGALRTLLQKEFAPLPDDHLPSPPLAGSRVWRSHANTGSVHTLVRVQASQAWKDLPPVLQTIDTVIQKGIVPGGVPIEQAE